MNKKQLVSMWCGVAVVVIYRFLHVRYYCYGGMYRRLTVYTEEGFFVNVFIIGLVTAALIYTFRNKKGG